MQKPPMHHTVNQALQHHYQTLRTVHMRELFAADPERFEHFSLQVGDILLDYSKNRITAETLQLLTQLAEVADVAGWRDRMFQGDKINNTEQRAVLHTALRNQSNTPVRVDGEDVMPDVNAVIAQMSAFASGYAAARGQAILAKPLWMW